MYLTEVEFLPGQHQQRQRSDNARFKRLLRLTPAFQLLKTASAERAEAEHYVQAKFQHAYGAEVHEFLDYLLSMHCPSGLSGVAGISLASEKTLFLEQYLDSPIEQELENILQSRVSRGSIAEIGNLVASTSGASLALFIVLATALSRAGYEHMVFTATDQLRAKFKRLGFETHLVKEASLNCLQAEAGTGWGSYYDSKPEVVTGSLQDALQLIASRKLFACLQRVFSKKIEALAAQLPVGHEGG